MESRQKIQQKEMFSFDGSFGKKAEEQLQNDLTFKKDEFYEQQTTINPWYYQSPEVEILVQQQEKKKCYYCFEEINKDSFPNHLIQCIKSYELLLKQSENDGEISQKKEQVLKNVPLTQSRTTCSYCSQYVFTLVIQEHEKQCEKKQYQKLKINFLTTEWKSHYFFKLCLWCTKKIPQKELYNHQISCEIKDNIYSSLVFQKLTFAQFTTMWKTYEKSAFENIYRRRELFCLMGKYGYSEDDLKVMSQFIQHKAPINIHFNLQSCITYFLQDGQYKNCFEAKTGKGLAYLQNRKQWQKYLFGDLYDQCQPKQRIKYGVLNYANDKYGSKKCCKYGDSIIVLNDDVRKRCTISHNRKYGNQEIVGTLKYSNNILFKFSEGQLKALSLASRGFEVDSSQLENFKEVHIHGPIRFSKDVKCIYTSKQERTRNFVNVVLFQNKFGVKVLTYEELEAQKTL